MHDLPARLINEMASARAAIAASYLRLWRGPDLDAPAPSAGSGRDPGEQPDNPDAGSGQSSST
jgi:hypothetical protein